MAGQGGTRPGAEIAIEKAPLQPPLRGQREVARLLLEGGIGRLLRSQLHAMGALGQALL